MQISRRVMEHCWGQRVCCFAAPPLPPCWQHARRLIHLIKPLPCRGSDDQHLLDVQRAQGRARGAWCRWYDGRRGALWARLHCHRAGGNLQRPWLERRRGRRHPGAGQGGLSRRVSAAGLARLLWQVIATRMPLGQLHRGGAGYGTSCGNHRRRCRCWPWPLLVCHPHPPTAPTAGCSDSGSDSSSQPCCWASQVSPDIPGAGRSRPPSEPLPAGTSPAAAAAHCPPAGALLLLLVAAAAYGSGRRNGRLQVSGCAGLTPPTLKGDTVAPEGRAGHEWLVAAGAISRELVQWVRR